MSKKQTTRGGSGKAGAPSSALLDVMADATPEQVEAAKRELKMPKAELKMPDKASVLEWVRKDLEAARALLTVVLNRHPEIVTEMAENMYETILRKEQGAGINHVPGAAETGLD